MKTAKSIIVVLFVLLTAQIASAYYCPSTGRWLSRDSIGEPGFQALQTITIAPLIGNSTSSQTTRWIQRDSIPRNNEPNTYDFVGNNPVKYFDSLGLEEYLPPSQQPPYDPTHPEKPSKKRVCRLIRSVKPGVIGNMGCGQCWLCTYRCEGQGMDPRGGSIQRYQIGGCIKVTGFVPGFPNKSDCESATVNDPPAGLVPGE